MGSHLYQISLELARSNIVLSMAGVMRYGMVCIVISTRSQQIISRSLFLSFVSRTLTGIPSLYVYRYRSHRRQEDEMKVAESFDPRRVAYLNCTYSRSVNSLLLLWLRSGAYHLLRCGLSFQVQRFKITNSSHVFHDQYRVACAHCHTRSRTT